MKRNNIRNGLLTLILMFAMMLGMSAVAFASNDVDYITHDENGAPLKATCTAYTSVTNGMGANWNNGWYVVQDNVTLSNLSINGTVNLILCDGAKLTAQHGIWVKDPNTLNIYGQSKDTGELFAEKPEEGVRNPGIGGKELQTAGIVNIHGGTVTATGEGGAAGIGGAYHSNGGTVTIYGGTVTAIGTHGGFGIGRGDGPFVEHGSLKVGAELAVYGGDDENSLRLITPSEGDYERCPYMLVTKPFTHTHSFTYSCGTGDQANTITATCTGKLECPQGYKTNPITLTLNKPSNLTYDAGAKAATLSGYPENAVENLVAKPEIEYYVSTGAGNTQTIGDVLSDTVVNAGDYVAQIKWGPESAEAVASVAFQIKPAPLTITAKDQSYVYDGQKQGPADVVYTDPAQLDRVAAVEGLQGDDALTSILIDGQGDEVGTYTLVPSDAAIGEDGALSANYAITYVNGTLTITKAEPKPEPPQPNPPKPSPSINKAAAKISLNAGVKAYSSGSKVTASWGKVKGASSYVIYANYCDQKTCKKIKTVSGKTTSFNITKLNGKKFNPKKNLKFYVVAYKTVKGKKVKLAKSILAHAPGSKNSKRTNVTGVKVKKASFTLKKGKTATIKAKLVLEKKNRKPLKHSAKFRYASSNKKIATVSTKGKITAVGKGKCTVYVYAVSGVSKAIKVTVK